MEETAKNQFAGTGKEIEPINKLRAECVIIGKTKSQKVKMILEPTNRNSFSGVGSFEIGGEKFYARVTLMPEKVGNIFAKRINGHVVYQEVDE